MFRKLLAVLIVIGLSFLIVPSASADRYRLMASTRTSPLQPPEQWYFHVPFFLRKIPYNSSTTLFYRYYPNGRSAWYIMPVFEEHCWTQPDQESHRTFQGTTVNTRMISDNGVIINPGPLDIPDRTDRQNCRTQTYPRDMRETTYGFNKPRWAAGVELRLAGARNHHHDYGEGVDPGGKYWRLRPITRGGDRKDTVISGWRNDER